MEYGYDELYHYGVKGQKWGVRRYQNKDGTLTAEGKVRIDKKTYREDKRRRNNLVNNAKEASRWSNAYRITTKYDDKKLEKRINMDMKKQGYLSEKTKEAQRVNAKLHEDKKIIDKISDRRISDAKSYISDMQNKYGSKKIRDIKTYEKDGREFVKYIIANDNALYTVELRNYIDSNGNRYKEYGRVKTRYYYR